MLPVFTESEIRAAVSPADAVRAIRDAFRADGLGHTGEAQGTLRESASFVRFVKSQ